MDTFFIAVAAEVVSSLITELLIKPYISKRSSRQPGERIDRLFTIWGYSELRLKKNVPKGLSLQSFFVSKGKKKSKFGETCF